MKKNPAIPCATSNAKLDASVSRPNKVDPLSNSSSTILKDRALHGNSTYFDPKHFPAQTVHSTFTQSHLSNSSSTLAGKSTYFDSKHFPAQTVHSTFTQSHLSNSSSTQAGKSTYFDSKHFPAQSVHSTFTQSGSGNGFHLSNSSNTQAGNGTPSFPWLAMNTAYPLGTNLSAGMLSGTGDIYSMNDTLSGQDTTVNGPSSKSLSSVKTKSSKAKILDGDVQKRYESFKNFDTVIDHSDHHYAKKYAAIKQPPKNWAKKIQDDWRILEKDLPDTIFVRVYESRMDLLRAVIIGAEGTPYHDGLFFFDVCFPSSYPSSPPLVHYHSGGLRINPNLYNCGKVCLSLLNTWGGSQKEMWVPGSSTMLQVLVSIQGLILNMKPYFNEPGFAPSSGSVQGEKSSLQYNENTLILSLKTMVYTMKKPPKNFEDLVIGHFQHRVRDILMACKAYTEGMQVGCVVKGGVQDVDEGNDSCSPKFKLDVGSYIKTLVAAFKKIGAKEAQEFLFLSEKKSSLLSAPTPTATE
ncbi:hypothetical protein L1987_70615 [Smallanthus sonchifolius]|uniref:Uncharacterized protein n=1 Tax=Smallanthus sonchifolius TaxID=185202 RepID=A0ACB9AQQ7_9ASTR|nr:hypothetical protein L1987_70615 [Smallanthus sonchifolius]